jgi:crotonobetainyl-CoA:carnitine CoA-transferase CaiB-like acyl-CoA transferase
MVASHIDPGKKMSIGPLGTYRGLDLTGEKGPLCGRILADLGAEVIKVEPPRGDPARNIGPFYRDVPDPERSLYWFSYNLNKKSITLDLQSRDGRDLFLLLARRVDFVIESMSLGELDALQLGWPDLHSVNQLLVQTSITPFGGKGPKSRQMASDLTLMAAGGYSYMTGEEDRAPLRISADQAWLHAAGEAAVSTIIALLHRARTSQGQHVVVSAQASIVPCTVNAIPFWVMNGTILERSGPYRVGLTSAKQRQLWPCKDGSVIFYLAGGDFGVSSNTALALWLDEEDLADDYIRSIDWRSFDMATADETVEAHLERLISRLFVRYTMAELYEQAITRGLTLCPVLSPGGILQNAQLNSRGYWTEVSHQEFGQTFKYPGPFARSTLARMPAVRAPRIGEHNGEIYHDELGLSYEHLLALKQAGVI